MKKFTEKSDDASDKKKGIREGSRKDLALDRKRGLPTKDDRPSKTKEKRK